MKSVRFTVKGHSSPSYQPTRRGLYLGRQLDFFKNSFSGGCLGTVPGGDTHFQAPGVTGGCFIREKPRKISFFTRFEALLSTATHPNLGQISIFLAHIDGHSMGIRHNFQKSRLVDCGGLQRHLSEVGRIYSKSSLVAVLPTGVHRPVSRTAVGLFENFLFWWVPGNNTRWGHPFSGTWGHWGLFY